MLRQLRLILKLLYMKRHWVYVLAMIPLSGAPPLVIHQ